MATRLPLLCTGFSNRVTESTCFDIFGNIINPRLLVAIRRIDSLEDAYNEWCEKHGVTPASRISKKYTAEDLLDDKLYNRLMDKYSGSSSNLAYLSA